METERKSLQHSSHTNALNKGTIFAKKCGIFAKENAYNSKIKRVLALKGIFPKTEYVRVLAYQIYSLSHNSNKF